MTTWATRLHPHLRRGRRGIYYRPRASGKVQPPYEFRYLDSDATYRWETVHGTLTAAEARRAELRLRRGRGEQIRPCRQCFAEYALEWLARQTGRPRTIEKYSWALRQHLIPYFGRYRLDQISADDIAAFITAMKRKGLKGSTVTTALRPLSIMLAQAARKGQIVTNPMHQLARGERPNNSDQRDKRILNLQEMQALLDHTSDLQHRLLLELLLDSGLRIGEALGLTLADLNPKDTIIKVDYQLDRDGNRTPLKTTGSRRALDIPERLMKQLLQLTASHGHAFNPQALVFQARTGRGLERKTCREALKRSSKSAQLTLPHPTLHDLRHSHASMLIHLGYSIADVQHRLGHQKPDTTLRIYTHQWDYHHARQSTIGSRLGELLTNDHSNSDQPKTLRHIGS